MARRALVPWAGGGEDAGSGTGNRAAADGFGRRRRGRLFGQAGQIGTR